MRTRTLLLPSLLFLMAACGSDARARTAAWSGTVDTLASGQIVVRNTADPVWTPGSGWEVVEELRIGAFDGEGPELFGRINALAVDAGDRIWVLEAQAQELRVFDTEGRYVRTVGRRGGGPGEFNQVVHVAAGPDGNLWAMDPQNNRLSVIDSAGVFIESKWASGGFIMLPWPGGFDGLGRYYGIAPRQTPGDFGIRIVRSDPGFEHSDTLDVPQDPVSREFFEHVTMDGGVRRGFTRASIPYQGYLQWRISREGTIWALVTDKYHLVELRENGDTIRSITKEFEPVAVTAAERDSVAEGLRWFTDQGGRIDLSKVPSTKPPTTGLFLDETGFLWVGLQPERSGSPSQLDRFDIFDPEGRFLGTVRLPFALSPFPAPVFKDGYLYGTTADEMEVPYVVKARIERSS